MLKVYGGQVFTFLTANDSQYGHLDEPKILCFCENTKVALKAGAEHCWVHIIQCCFFLGSGPHVFEGQVFSTSQYKAPNMGISMEPLIFDSLNLLRKGWNHEQKSSGVFSIY